MSGAGTRRPPGRTSAPPRSSRRSPARTPQARRRRTTRIVATALAVALVGGLVAAAVSGIGGGGDKDDQDGAGPATSTTMATGGIDVSAPDGWTAIPVASLGFGVAVPPGWEATVLSQEVLESLERASPQVPGFLDLAHAAAESGAVFYAAGEDDAGRLADVKVRAAPGAGVGDVAQLEDYARQLASSAGLEDAAIERVEGAERPTVRMRYRVARAPASPEDGADDAGSDAGSTTTSTGPGPATAEGTETLVAGPNDIVWSVIVTSEDPAAHDDLAARLTDTLAFPPG
jgi:hypothetical protein